MKNNDYSKIKIIAFYLPQYYPTQNNDKWWGAGFTEWRNVVKANRLFPGHYQPKIPGDLGFYDLRLPQVRERQVELAIEAGVNAFCYYHYWFGNGRRELDLPFSEVVNSGKPDFPFCLCWANESWHSKFWNKDGTVDKECLVEQIYSGKTDNEDHFYSLLNAFKDKRYLRYKGKPIFIIYRPFKFRDIKEFMKQWNDLAIKNGFEGFHFVGQTPDWWSVDDILELGLNGVNQVRLYDVANNSKSFIKRNASKALTRWLNLPLIVSYKKAIPYFVGDKESQVNVYPTLIPNWDHTPRSGRGGFLLHNSTPKLFYKHVLQVFGKVSEKPVDDQIVFLKSWNEWGEGNYMEPDLKFGKGYIIALREALNFR